MGTTAHRCRSSCTAGIRTRWLPLSFCWRWPRGFSRSAVPRLAAALLVMSESPSQANRQAWLYLVDLFHKEMNFRRRTLVAKRARPRQLHWPALRAGLAATMTRSIRLSVSRPGENMPRRRLSEAISIGLRESAHFRSTAPSSGSHAGNHGRWRREQMRDASIGAPLILGGNSHRYLSCWPSAGAADDVWVRLPFFVIVHQFKDCVAWKSMSGNRLTRPIMRPRRQVEMSDSISAVSAVM